MLQIINYINLYKHGTHFCSINKESHTAISYNSSAIDDTISITSLGQLLLSVITVLQQQEFNLILQRRTIPLIPKYSKLRIVRIF